MRPIVLMPRVVCFIWVTSLMRVRQAVLSFGFSRLYINSEFSTFKNEASFKISSNSLLVNIDCILNTIVLSGTSSRSRSFYHPWIKLSNNPFFMFFFEIIFFAASKDLANDKFRLIMIFYFSMNFSFLAIALFFR